MLPSLVAAVVKKAGRKLRNKCYDCLPLIVHHMCAITVPVLSDHEMTVVVNGSTRWLALCLDNSPT